MGIKRKSRVIKEGIRARWTVLPYQVVPSITTAELAKGVVTWLNSIMSQSALLPGAGARLFTTGVHFDYNIQPGIHILFFPSKGLKQFSLRAATTGKKEMGQLSERETLKPGDFDGLSEKKHDEIIDSLLFTGEERDKLIKGQMVPRGDQ